LFARGVFLLLAGLALLAASVPAVAQLGTGTIEGSVLDPTGAVIPDARVTLKNTATGVERTLTTDSTGRYRAVALEPGLYTIKAEKSGFRAVERADVQVTVGTTTVVDISLAVAGAAETVVVTEAPPVVDPDKTDITSVVDQTVVSNVPVIGRRWDNYVLLTPAVSPDGTFGLVTYRGISGLYNNNTVDGADNNQAFFSEARGRTRAVYTWSQAAIKEFQVGISNFNAEYGRAAGGLVNAVTKSGTNAFHGEAFYFLRDDFTSAREPTIPVDVVQNAIDKKKLPERRQQFGFAMGGPIKKDKLFWFLNYDQQIRNFPYVVTTSNALFLQTNCTSPAPGNATFTCQFFENERTVVGRTGHNNVVLGRLDWRLNQDNNLAIYYNWHKWRSQNGIRTPLTTSNAESDNGFDGVRTDSLFVRWNSVFSPQLVNEFRFQFGRDNELQRPNAPGPGTSVTGAFTFGMPNFLPRGRFPFEKRFQFVENLSYLMGKHSFKFGVDVNYVREKLVNLFQGGGVYSYSTFGAISGDCPPDAVALGCVPDGTPSYGSFTQAFDRRFLNSSPDEYARQAGSIFFVTTDYNFYAQDTWKLRPSLTLNYGIRYEFQELPQPDISNPLFPLTQHFNQDKNNFAPRVGLAWDIGNRHRTVLRTGYGLIYGRTSNSTISAAMTDNGALFATFQVFSNTDLNPAPGDQGDRLIYADCFFPATNSACSRDSALLLGAFTAQAPDIFQLSEDFVRPLVHQAELSLEHEVFKNLLVSATYAWSGGRRLPIFRDINLPPPGNVVFINVRADLVLNGQTVFPAGVYGPFPFFCVANATAPAGNCPATSVRPNSSVRRQMQGESVGTSSYNGLILRVQRRMERGFMFDTHFTWSHSIDNGQNSLTFFGRNTTNYDPLNREFDRANSDFDIRRRFVTTFVWQPGDTFRPSGAVSKRLVGGWTLSGSFTAQDGRPETPFLSGFLTAGNTRPIDTGSSNGTGGLFRAPFISRNSFNRPGYVNLDFRVARDFRLGETWRIEVIAESFNLFNRSNFTSVDTTGFCMASATSVCPFVAAFPAGTSNNYMSNPAVANSQFCGPLAISTGTRCLVVDPAAPELGFLNPRAASSTLSGPREFQFAIRVFW
jgi:hypothetical protein